MTYEFRRLVLVGLALAVCLAGGVASAGTYRAGVAKTDITGPPVGFPMFGYPIGGQATVGIRLRQHCRAFVIHDSESDRHVAIAVVDLGSVTLELQKSVVDRLGETVGEVYGVENVVVTATHTHAGCGGFWHHGSDTPLGSPFYEAYFHLLADRIAEAITQAHEALGPAEIRVARGSLTGAGANRSLPAYRNNPADERARYDADTDTEMLLLEFVGNDGPMGSINWFAVHPTSMSFQNDLISGDNKGYAAYQLEKEHASDSSYVAAFAQSNCGDVTPRLSLDQKGPGTDDFESTAIIGGKQADKAAELERAAEEPVVGPLDFRHAYVDFSSLRVADEFTGAGEQRTCPSALGYSFAAGSTEDGGGHPLFQEGMYKSSPVIDRIVKTLGPLREVTDACRECHQPKPVLFPTGYTDPPAQPQVLSIGVIRLGQIVFLVGSAEFTTMTGRRFRDAIAEVMGDSVRDVVILGFANGYTNYVTTREEYAMQHYEGASTLFGPWTEAAYRQEYSRLAHDLAEGRPSETHAPPEDPRGSVPVESIETSFDRAPSNGKSFGDVASEMAAAYPVGSAVEVSFWTGNPRNYFADAATYFTIQRQEGDSWIDIASDADWETICWWRRPSTNEPFRLEQRTNLDTALRDISGQLRKLSETALVLTIRWEMPRDTAPGTYRIVHRGGYKETPESAVTRFTSESRPFAVTAN